MERQFYTINESMAKTANDANSMSDYVKGSATAEYVSKVEEVYNVVDKIAVEKPHLLEKAQRMADRYSRRLANYYNDYYRNEASCPSILISGGSNFPVKKKNRQNSRRDTLYKEYVALEEYAGKIIHLLTMQQPILSGDAQAVALLEDKLEGLVELQEHMKAVNAYYRKNKTLDGCPELTEKEIKSLKSDMAQSWHLSDVPYARYLLSNNSASIRSTRERLERLKKVKETGTQETESKFFKIVENTEIMRLQLIFDDKPEEQVRDILKKNAFKWSPKNNCWQRQLTENAKYSLKCVIRELNKILGETTEQEAKAV